jgi:hypothetical protein
MEKYGKDLRIREGNELEYLKMLIKIEPDGTVRVSGPGYIKGLLSKFRSSKGPVDDYPMIVNPAERKDDYELVDDSTEYRSLVGAMSYFAITYRSDLLYVMSVLGSGMAQPQKRHMRMAERVLRFIEGTVDVEIIFRPDGDFQLYAWADASFATRELSRSQSGYCFALGLFNASFYSKSSKQQLVTTSSTEAEYVSMFTCACELVWLRRILSQLGFPQGPTKLYQDNQSTISWAQARDHFHKTKHVKVKYHFVRELINNAIIDVEYLNTNAMRADLFTKALNSETYWRLLEQEFGYRSE